MTLTMINPASLGAPSGYSHGVLAPAGGRLLFVAGQSGKEGDFVAQFVQSLSNVVAVVREAGGGPEHLGRLTIYVTDKRLYLAALEPLGKAYRKVMGKHYPAMALLEVKALVNPKALVEIEGTAVIP